MRYFYCIAITLLVLAGTLWAQPDTQDDIYLMQPNTYFRDAAISRNPHLQGAGGFLAFDRSDVITLGAQGKLPVGDQVQLGGEWNVLFANPDAGDSQSGLSDPRLSGKYNFDSRQSKFSVGGWLDLPIGKERLGHGELDLGFFGSVRHPLNNRTALSGILGLDFIKSGDRNADLLLAAGIIHKTNSQLGIVGELSITTETEVGVISGGVDYQLRSGGHLRGALGFGFSDGAPDIALLAMYLLNFN